jgi:hypothetical protein
VRDTFHTRSDSLFAFEASSFVVHHSKGYIFTLAASSLHRGATTLRSALAHPAEQFCGSPTTPPTLPTTRHLQTDITHSPRCLSRSAIRRWTPSPPRKSLPLLRHTILARKTSPPHGVNMDVPSSTKRPTSTPQNTPANAAPISSRAQQPGVGTIKEGTSQYGSVLPLQPRLLASRRA